MIHIAIVSHGHEDLLIAGGLAGLLHAGAGIAVWVKDNRPGAALRQFCAQHAIAYSDANPGLGFGENNNFLFGLIRDSVGFGAGDLFIVLNPDVQIAAATVHELARLMQADRFPLATLNLYRDAALCEADANIRRFPGISGLPRMLLARSLSQPYRKEAIGAPCHVDWASGALLAFDAAHYARLGGFDERYFMYFEDVDLCYRSYKLLGQGVRYYPQLKAVHSAARQNRNLLSRHAKWFFSSFFKFLTRRYLVLDRQGALPAAE